jgi:hypothetical protein
MTALLDNLSVAFTTSNVTAMEGLLSTTFVGTFTATGCRSLDRTEFLQALEAKYFGPKAVVVTPRTGAFSCRCLSCKAFRRA